MPRGRPHPPEPADLGKLVKELYQLHAEADDSALSRWPYDEDLLGVLQYVRDRHRALPPVSESNRQRATQAMLRLAIVRRLRPVLDAAELAGIDDARSAGVPWHEIAVALGVERPGSAANRRERLLAAQSDPHARRTPEVGRRVTAERLSAEDRDRRAAAAARSRFAAVRDAAVALLEHVDDLLISEDAETWLSGVREILASDNPTPTEQQALSAYLGLMVSEVKLAAAVEEVPAAQTEQAVQALQAAADVC